MPIGGKKSRFRRERFRQEGLNAKKVGGGGNTCGGRLSPKKSRGMGGGKRASNPPRSLGRGQQDIKTGFPDAIAEKTGERGGPGEGKGHL